MVSARYIQQHDTDKNSVSAKEFYFESDLLDGGTHEIIPTENGGTTASVTIRLMNYVDELRYSGTKIDYTVTATEKSNGTALADTNIGNRTGTIDTDAKHYADVTLSNLQAGKTYTVTATTSNIYKKTLTGTIEVASADTAIHASISNNTDQYVEVTVWTTDYAGEVKVSYGDIGLIPDNTDSMMDGKVSTGGTITKADWGTNTSHVFRFFKTTASTTYQTSVSETEVTVSAKQ